MLLGQFRVARGNKNRIAFPKKLREIQGENLLITNWFEKSLIILPVNGIDVILKEIEEGSLLLPEVRDVQRFIFGGMTEVELDAQGRFVLPAYLKEYASIQKEVVFVGAQKYVELWDQEVWNNYRSLMKIQMRETAIKIVERKEGRNT